MKFLGLMIGVFVRCGVFALSVADTTEKRQTAPTIDTSSIDTSSFGLASIASDYSAVYPADDDDNEDYEDEYEWNVTTSDSSVMAMLLTSGGDSQYEYSVLTPDASELKFDWKWCLLTLAGNATIIQLRQKDFINYLRINVASLTGATYDEVLFNNVSYLPEIIVNVTLNWHSRSDRILRVLGQLAEDNDTILDLSGCHFNLTDFVPASAILAPKPINPMGSTDPDPREVEAIIYMSVGAAIAFLLTASLIFAVCQCIKAPKRNNAKENEEEQHETQYSLNDYPSANGSSPPPKLIYSQAFTDRLPVGQTYTPLDDNLSPLVPFEDDTPRYVIRPSDSRNEGDLASLRTETDSLLHSDSNGQLRPPSRVISPFYQMVAIEPALHRSGSSNHIQSPDQPVQQLTSFKPVRPTQEEIDRDVHIVFRNMGLMENGS